MIDWMRQELHIDLTTCAADSHVPRVENAIRFVTERVGFIQSKPPFTKYPKKLTIEMVKRVTVLINSFNRKSGVHSKKILYSRLIKAVYGTLLGPIIFYPYQNSYYINSLYQ